MPQKKKKTSKTGLKYSDIEDIVEYLVGTKAHQNAFDCYEIEDVAQEIRLICLKAIEHFDVDRVKKDKLVNFFGRCVDNALKNLKRDNYIRYTPPCNNDCKYLHGDEYMDDDLSKVCRKWIKFKKRIQAKINVRHPVSIHLTVEKVHAPDFLKEVEAEDFKKYLLSKIDPDLRGHLINILEGDRRDVPAKPRHKIQRFIKKFLKE